MSAEEIQQITQDIATMTVTPATKPPTAKTGAKQPQQQPKKGPHNNNKKAPAKKGGKKDDDLGFDLDAFIAEVDAKEAKNAANNTNKSQNVKQQQAQAATLGDPSALIGKKLDKHCANLLGHAPADFVPPSYTDKDGSIVTQTSPPTIPVARFFTETGPPVGMLIEHTKQPEEPNNTQRTSAAERRKDLLTQADLICLRHGAEVHRQVRQDIQCYLQPGVKLIDIAAQLEKSTLDLIGYDPLNPLHRGRGFPTGLNVSNLTTGRSDVAHWAPNPNDTTVIHKDDVIKIDFGTQVNGFIIDSAFTWHMNETFDPIVEATREATRAAIAAAGVDVRLGDIGAVVDEVISSYEMDINGVMTPCKPIKNLFGHSIGRYKIHSGKSVPQYDNSDATKMEEGELFAIETFAACGRANKVGCAGENSHFMRNFDVAKATARAPGAVKLWNAIDKQFNTLAFCPRWLIENGQREYPMALKQLCDAGSINPYPPLVLPKGTHSSQCEHTIAIGATHTEVLSKGWDY